MRKLLAAVFAHVLALAFLMVGSAPAHAFGSEVLGCVTDTSPTTAWTANSCEGSADNPPPVIHFSPHNLSGSYSMSWTLTRDTTAITANCSSTVTVNCISGGCTASSTTCDVRVQSTLKTSHTYTASLRLTQSGLSRTIQAQALMYGEGGCVPSC